VIFLSLSPVQFCNNTFKVDQIASCHIIFN